MNDNHNTPADHTAEMLLTDRSWSAEIAPPVDMSATDVNEARQHVEDMVRGLRESTGSRQLMVLDEVTAVGLNSQRNAGRQLELVKTRLGSMLDAGGAGSAVASNLVDLRTALDRINPHLEQQSLRSRAFAAVPFLRSNSMVRALKKIAVRYEPVSQQVSVIETKLREGRSLLLRDNVELRRLYEDVEAQDVAIRRQAFIGEMLLHALTTAPPTQDESERNRLHVASHQVATRLQDLRTMLEVHAQFFVSIELTRQNNVDLSQAVDRTLALSTNVVTIGLAIQAALVRQHAIKEAAERTREFLGETMAQNAAAIRRQTEEIGDLSSSPVIALDKLRAAHRDLIAAVEATTRLRQQGLEAARRNIDELAVMTGEMAVHVHGVEREQQAGGS